MKTFQNWGVQLIFFIKFQLISTLIFIKYMIWYQIKLNAQNYKFSQQPVQNIC